MASVEGDFFGVMHQIGMAGSVFSFELLFDCCESSEGRRDESEDKSGYEVPDNAIGRTLPSQEVGKLAREQDDVEDRLGEIGVEVAEGVGPFFDVGGESLVWVGDSGVDVGKLVEDHVFDVFVVEIGGEALSEVDCESLVEEIEVAVDEGGGDGAEGEAENLLDELVVVKCDDGSDDSSVDCGNVDREEGTEDEENGELSEVHDFRSLPVRNDDLEEFQESLEEDGIDISFSFFGVLFEVDLHIAGFGLRHLEMYENKNDENDGSGDDFVLSVLGQ
jgi:hypothetical protein